ncbi:MAG: NAD(P)/FAD-dependent oxidoreductase [Pseudomonadota bacterium]
MSHEQGLNIAVIGAGVAGLVSAWLLGSRHRVCLFEANDYPGGHTHTVMVGEAGRELAVDTGFIVYNEPNYPHLSGLFAHLGVETRPSDMTFSVSVDGGRLEYAGNNLDTLFAQRGNLLRPAFLGMVRDILRFNRLAKAALSFGPAVSGESLGEFLDREGFDRPFRHHYLLPMAAAIWSCPTATMLRFPFISFARFFENHGLLNLVDRPQWRTVVGGSKTYVDRLLASGRFELRLSVPVHRVARSMDGVWINDDPRRFDAVVFASHADQCLVMMDAPDAVEHELLGAFSYQQNIAWLHGDPRLMPRLSKVWSSWNYLGYGMDVASLATERVAVTYWMNRLQGLPGDSPYLVTLNPPFEPAEGAVFGRYVYHHPVFDERAMSAQTRMPALQGHRRSWYCGSYLGYGFHEDAVRSAVDLAGRFGISPPWGRV